MSVPTLAQLVPGAPGIYRVVDEPIRALTGVRMDVCAFVGVAPRGPARDPYFDEPWAPQPCTPGEPVRLATPVAVESWSEYTRLYGAFEGPGRLPYAVAAFFENGGQRAYIVRVVHQYVKADGTPDAAADEAGRARSVLEGVTAAGGRRIWVRARNEGRWGNALRATLSFAPRVLALDTADFFPDRLRVPIGLDLPRGTTLRLLLGGGAKAIRRVTRILDDWNPIDGSRERWAYFDTALAAAALQAEIVEGRLDVDDGVNPTETHERVGLSPDHPRWLAAVLVNDSERLYPSDDPDHAPGDPLASWLRSHVDVGDALAPAATDAFTGGADRYADLVPGDFFDDDWVLGNDCPGRGIHALTELGDLSLVTAPDLYSPGPLAAVEPIVQPSSLAGAAFAECVPVVPPPAQAPPPEELTGLRLDPPQDLDAIVGLQRRMTDLADALESFIVLLDVPPGLSQRRMLYWRGKFDSAYAAAYYPWLTVARSDDARDALISVNPSAAAAGIIAQREFLAGVPFGPANVVAAGAVGVDDRVSPPRHDELHQNAVNVYLHERDGIRLTAGRTLSRDAHWRQLNVRRLVTMIRRALEQQMQWTVFEPNSGRLRFRIARMLEAFLRQLFRANAFAGATEAQAFFVTCDETLNPPYVQQNGQLIAHIGVAPAEPLEFIVLNLARQGDQLLIVEAG